MSKQKIEGDQMFVCHGSEANDKIYEVAKGFVPRLWMKIKNFPGWARRDIGGDDLTGAKYIEPYKEFIKQCVEEGNRRSDMKWSAAKIQERIVLDNPRKFKIPSTHEIQLCINSTLQQAKQESQSVSRRPRNTIEELPDDECQCYIQEYLKKGNFDKMPEEKYKAFVGQFPAREGDRSKEQKKRVKAQLKKIDNAHTNKAYESIM
ncbi:predicted protein [Chaetoceros tenuissimus]|uniref:Uncharacterized protein n=1 Tax=Chaetoceros tenuissimus TaxID=426638 RepID=A0AAD3H3T0_9STRA|nr:predicted protein [Chaetoceros tenuissimus]